MKRLTLALAAALCLLSCHPGDGPDPTPADTIVGHERATEAVLRSIPAAYIEWAKTSLHVAYQHTSHGTHVSYGLYGLAGYKSGDETRYAITQNAATPSAAALDFHDNQIWPAGQSTFSDLSQADANWPAWRDQLRAYLDDADNASINVMMWSWCDITGHNVSTGYLPSMRILIDEYGPGGSKIGTGAGKTRAMPVTFVFMTGHAYTYNVGDKKPRDQAKLITDYCSSEGYYCLDYYSIDSHDMAGAYYEDADDNAHSAAAGKSYNQDWQDSHTEGLDWFRNLSSPGGDVSFGEHESQYITANRKAYAMWYILARIAGWDGVSTE